MDILKPLPIMRKLFTYQPIMLAIVVVLMIFTSSCATIFSGATQKVYIDSRPPGATIVINGENKGTTPRTIKVQRELDAFEYNFKEIKLVKDGYKEDYQLYASFNPVCALNILNLGIFAVIDGMSGSVCRYQKTTVFELVKQDEDNVEQDEDFVIDKAIEKLKKLKYLYEEGVITEEEYKREKEKLYK